MNRNYYIATLHSENGDYCAIFNKSENGCIVLCEGITNEINVG